MDLKEAQFYDKIKTDTSHPLHCTLHQPIFPYHVQTEKTTLLHAFFLTFNYSIHEQFKYIPNISKFGKKIKSHLNIIFILFPHQNQFLYIQLLKGMKCPLFF